MSPVKKAIAAFTVIVIGLCLTAVAAAAHKVSEGSVEKEKSLLTAGADGAVLLYQSGLVLRLQPHTQIRQHKDAKLWLDSTGRTPAHVFTLLAGRADLAVPGREGRARQAALVRAGQRLSVATSGGRMSALAGDEFGVVVAYEGNVVASDGGRWLPVKVGTGLKMMSGAQHMEEHLLPQAPILHSKRKVWLALQGPVPVGDFSWETSDVNQRYALVLSSQDRATIHRTTVAKKGTGPVLTSLPGGLYSLSVQALDSYGLAGPAGTLTFSVVGVHNHRGSRVDADGVIHVGINQRARFTHVEGLLMTYGTAKRWATATETVPLWRHERTTVHFRHPDYTDMVSARLEPRGVSAEVYIGPKTVVWPGQSVQIRVRIKDIKGAIPEDLDVKLNVSLGIKEVPVEWAKQGNLFTASVPSRTGAGPWVLRISVVDRFGIELGRDFVEIAGKNKPKQSPRPKTPKSVIAAAEVPLARATSRASQ